MPLQRAPRKQDNSVFIDHDFHPYPDQWQFLSTMRRMPSGTLTSPPIATARLVVDTDVASFIFKWHPEYAPRNVDIVRGFELVASFMTLAEMRQGALDANWGQRKRDMLEAYLAAFSVLHSDSLREHA